MALPDTPPDPHGVLAWINAVLETVKQAYVALVVPAGAMVLWLFKRKDRAQERADARQKTEDDAHQKISDQLDRDSAERFELMRGEIAALRRERTGLQEEINRLQALIRQWFDLAHDMWHQGNNRIQRLTGLMERGGMPVPERMALPALSYDSDKP